MTPVPFELPLRASDAAAIADLLFQQVEGRPLTEDQRGRFAGRLSAIETPTVTAYPGSLAADPIHPSTYYLAVDGANHGITTPLLLRIGLASAPGTSFFPKAVMIGRMRPSGGREVVVSAIPFGPGDQENIQTFAELVDKSFLPKPHGGQATVIVRTADPAADLPAAFEGFRQGPRQMAAVVEVPLDSFWTAVWAAVRSGRREAYSVGVAFDLSQGREAALRQAEQAVLFTKYVIPAGEDQLDDAGAVMDHVRRAKAGLSSVFTRTADFELAVSQAAQIAPMLAGLKASGRAVQSVSPGAYDSFDGLLESVRPTHTLLTLVAGAEVPACVRVNQRIIAGPGVDLRAAILAASGR